MKPLRVKKLTVIFSIVQLLNVCVPIGGRYVVEVRLFGYDNPTQRCQGCRNGQFANPGCCDGHDALNCPNDFRCDSYFFYCLRTLNSPVERNCSYFGNRMSTVNGNDGTLNFSQSVVLDLENPLQLQGLTNTYNGVQLYTEIQDEDPDGGHDFVDFVTVDHNLGVNQTSSRRNHGGFYEFVTMDLTIRVVCAQGFQGADCTECTPGFTGPNCDEVDNCFQVTCSGNGQCVDGMDSFTCSCNPGFTGDLCQTNIDVDNCVGVDCSGNGRCVDGMDSYTCTCDAGFTGELCQNNDQNDEGDRTPESSNLIALIVGCVLGGLGLVILLLLLIVCIVLVIMASRRRQKPHDKQTPSDSNGQSGVKIALNQMYNASEDDEKEANGSGSDALPVYDEIDNAQSLKMKYINLSPADSSARNSVLVDNPIYGGEDMSVPEVFLADAVEYDKTSHVSQRLLESMNKGTYDEVAQVIPTSNQKKPSYDYVDVDI